MKGKSRAGRIAWWAIKVVLAFSCTFAAWSASCWFLTNLGTFGVDVGALAQDYSDDLPDVLFGASSLALFVISFLVAVLAIFGGEGVKFYIDGKVTKSVQEETESLANEMRGRVLSALGYLNGEMSMNNPLEPNDLERLEEAVDLCRSGYTHLKEVGGPAEFMGLNNYLYYSAALGSRGESLLADAKRLLDAAERHNSITLKLTACRVILENSDERQDLQRALRVLERIRKLPRGKVKERERTEAGIYLRKHGRKALSRPSKEPSWGDILKMFVGKLGG